MLAISVDNLEEASEVVQMLGIPFPILYDPSTEAPQSYMVYNLLGDGLATPSTFVLDKEGVITWKYIARSIGDRPSVSTILTPAIRLGANRHSCSNRCDASCKSRSCRPTCSSQPGSYRTSSRCHPSPR